MASSQPVGFIKLLSQNFDIATFIPKSFTQHYYADLGRDRKYSLTSVLSALLIMQIFHIPTTALLTIFLVFSTEIRDFCSFYDSIPDESFFSRFKTDFQSDIANLFDSMALEVIDICEKIDDNLPEDSPYKNLSSMLIYDTSGLKPKTVNTLTMRSDLYLTCIAKLINVILAYAINKPEYIRSINKLLKIA
jgi:hypothetical protein